MTLTIPVVTYQHLLEYSQTAVYNCLKNRIPSTTISRIRGRATIEVRKGKDYPLVEVNFPKVLNIDRNRTDYNRKKTTLQFIVTIHSMGDAESIQFTDLVSYTLDTYRTDLHTAQLSHFNITDITNTYKWDTKIEKKFYTSNIVFTVVWRGA